MKNKNIRPVKGMRDFSPAEMLLRQKMMDIIRRNFKSFGYLPLETPTLESLDLLMEKYGDEGSKLIYNFEDRGGRPLGMIYDLTVPLSRYVAANYNDIKTPFKRYQIQRVYRYDKPQRGRFREFYQCDIDVIGSASLYSDAEVLITSSSIIKELGFEDFEILVNSREFLNNYLEKEGVEGENAELFMTAIDKLDKMDRSDVIKYLESKGFPADANKLIDGLKSMENGPPDDIIEIRDYFSNFFDPGLIKFYPLLARGLSYYTGTVFEFVLKGEHMGTVAAGGRYDGLIENFLGIKVPSCGIALGFERLFQILWEKQDNALAYYDAIIINSGNTGAELKALKELASIGLSVVYYPAKAKMGKQFKYADNYNIKNAVIIGDDELQKKEITVKNLETREQSRIPENKLMDYLLEGGS